MQRRQLLQESVIRAVLNTMESDHISEWEKQRACLKHDPDLWAVDQDKHAHAEAIRICNTECPVKQKCLEDFKKRRADAKLSGVYAGQIFDGTKRSGYDVETWHSTHKKGGEPKDLREGRKYPQGWTDIRICECGERFEVNPRNHTKKYCSQECITFKQAKRAKEKARGK